MERSSKTTTDVVNLLKTSELLTQSVRTVIEEWSQESSGKSTNSDGAPKILPSRTLHEAQRTILAICGTLTELVSEPPSRVIEVACQYWESRALYIAAERRIPDLLSTPSAKDTGISALELGKATGIEHQKLSRLLRCLCSVHIFREVAPDVFANNVASAALVNNEPLRAYVLLFNLDLYTASDQLPKYLLGGKGHSYKVDETAWQDAVGTTKPRWDWLEEKHSPNDLIASSGAGYPGLPSLKQEDINGVSKEKQVGRPEHEVFGLAMLGGGLVFGAAHPYDYPWDQLGEATIVDVGGGVGGFDIQLSRLYPKLKFVIQDRGPVLEQGEHTVWPKENPQALADGCVRFMQHDFFDMNPVKDADVYWLRYIIHDWSTPYALLILRAIRASMTSRASRILICDQVMNTTLGSPQLQGAPSPLPANYGYYTRYSHHRDLAMMGIINGIERTPRQFRELVEEAGLRVERIWECRSQVSVVECRAVFGPENGIEGGKVNGVESGKVGGGKGGKVDWGEDWIA